MHNEGLSCGFVFSILVSFSNSLEYGGSSAHKGRLLKISVVLDKGESYPRFPPGSLLTQREGVLTLASTVTLREGQRGRMLLVSKPTFPCVAQAPTCLAGVQKPHYLSLRQHLRFMSEENSVGA